MIKHKITITITSEEITDDGQTADLCDFITKNLQAQKKAKKQGDRTQLVGLQTEFFLTLITRQEFLAHAQSTVSINTTVRA